MQSLILELQSQHREQMQLMRDQMNNILERQNQNIPANANESTRDVKAKILRSRWNHSFTTQRTMRSSSRGTSGMTPYSPQKSLAGPRPKKFGY